jgi:hypothetical protein
MQRHKAAGDRLRGAGPVGCAQAVRAIAAISMRVCLSVSSYLIVALFLDPFLSTLAASRHQNRICAQCLLVATMKTSASLLLSLPCFAAAAAVQQAKVSYDGYKVFRVAVGDEVAKVNGIVEKLGLATWKGAPRANAMADIVVPPAQLEAFNAEIGDMDSITMHEDLGASIAEESDFSVYAGTQQPHILL